MRGKGGRRGWTDMHQVVTTGDTRAAELRGTNWNSKRGRRGYADLSEERLSRTGGLRAVKGGGTVRWRAVKD